jgi:HEAT repeat protein
MHKLIKASLIILALLSVSLLLFRQAPQQQDIHAELRQRILEAELGSATAVHFASTPEAPIPSDESFGKVVGRLAGNSPEQRWQAADELVRRADPRAVDAIIAAMHDPSGTRRICVMASALGKLKDPRALSALTTAAFDPANRDLRLCAIQSLGMIGDRDAVPTLIKAVRERNMPIAAANALAKLGDERAVEVLIETASDPALSLWMINALGELGAAAGEPYLNKLLKTQQSHQLQRATDEALWKLSVLTGNHSAQALQQVLTTNQTTTRRSWAAYKLGERKDATATLALIHTLNDQQADVQGRAAAALVAIGKPALSDIRQVLQESGTSPWLLAVLGYLGDSSDKVALRYNTELPDTNAAVARVSLTMIQRRNLSETLEPIIPVIN